jgi:hypothetical protein
MESKLRIHEEKMSLDIEEQKDAKGGITSKLLQLW